jgi:hypothetical protein
MSADPGAVHRRLEYLPLDSLTPNPANPKKHTAATLDASVNRFGFVENITRDDRTGLIISGHGRADTLKAMRDRGGTPGRCHAGPGHRRMAGPGHGGMGVPHRPGGPRRADRPQPHHRGGRLGGRAAPDCPRGPVDGRGRPDRRRVHRRRPPRVTPTSRGRPHRGHRPVAGSGTGRFALHPGRGPRRLQNCPGPLPHGTGLHRLRRHPRVGARGRRQWLLVAGGSPAGIRNGDV